MKNKSRSFAYQFCPFQRLKLSNDKYNIIDELTSENNSYWLHFEHPSKILQQKLVKKLNLNKQIKTILFSEEQRPRCIKIDNGFILIIQGIEISNVAQQKETPSLRFLITSDRLVSIATGSLKAIDDIENELNSSHNPTSMYCLATILEYQTWYIEEAAYHLDEALDRIEENIANIEQCTADITEVRQSIVKLRRYIIPQRDAIILLSNKIDSITQAPISLFKEVSDGMMRQAEMLEMLRERATIIQDNLTNQIGELSNRRMYLLTIIMLIFTPAFFVMGLFSMYIPIPFMNDNATWWVIFVFIILSSLGLFGLFKKKKWL